MNILTLHGSARQKGNTARLLTVFEKELENLGHSAQRIYVPGKEIKGCIGCGKCKDRPDKIGCVQKDDCEGVLTQMIEADALLFASPAYFWGFTAQMKLLIDRSYSLVCGYHTPQHSSLIEGKRAALLITGGGIYTDNVEPIFDGFQRLRDFHKTQNGGDLFVEGCTMDYQMPDDAEDRVAQFAKTMVG